MSSIDDSPDPVGYDKAAADRYFAAEAEKKRREEAERAAEAERLAKNTSMEDLDGGAKRKRTTRTKKMKRRHTRKSHRKFKRVMKRDRI